MNNHEQVLYQLFFLDVFMSLGERIRFAHQISRLLRCARAAQQECLHSAVMVAVEGGYIYVNSLLWLVPVT